MKQAKVQPPEKDAGDDDRCAVALMQGAQGRPNRRAGDETQSQTVVFRLGVERRGVRPDGEGKTGAESKSRNDVGRHRRSKMG